MLEHVDITSPIWTPTAEDIERANATALARRLGQSTWDSLWRYSVEHRESFWEAVVSDLGIAFVDPPERMMAPGADPRSPTWLPGARLNITNSCFKAPSNRLALKYTENNELAAVTYSELRDLVSNAAAQFRPGQRVGIVMPMSVAAVVGYLAAIHAGAVVVSVADSFTAPEIARRLALGEANAVITQDVVRRGSRIFPMLEKVRAASIASVHVVRTPEGADVRLQPGESEWLVEGSRTGPGAHVARPSEPINILFSSGTTGNPKAIPWSHITPIKAAMDGRYHQDIGSADVTCWPTSLGWMMGPWLVFATLINRATLALYDDAPTGRGFGEFVRDAGVTMLGVVPSLVRRWRASKCMDGLDWSAVRRFSSTGEASNPADMSWLSRRVGGRPVIEYCGGTEIGGGYISGTMVQPCLPSAFSTPTLGMDLEILDDQGAPAEQGQVYLVPPSMGLSSELIGGNHEAVYHEHVPAPHLRRHGDEMLRLPGGYYAARGRSDDTMNLGGIKVSSAEIERCVALDGVLEVAAVATEPAGGGPSRLVLFLVLENESGPTDAEGWRDRAQEAIRRQLNPLFRVAEVRLERALPRTASNKVMRRVLRARLESEEGEDVTSW